jgi:hypothetical protein
MSPLVADIVAKVFWGDERKFLDPLMRFVRRDVRDHIAHQKNVHGALYRRYRALQRRSRLKINFCETFGVVRFSTFATLSAQSGRHRRRDECPLLAMKQTWESELAGFR